MKISMSLAGGALATVATLVQADDAFPPSEASDKTSNFRLLIRQAPPQAPPTTTTSVVWWPYNNMGVDTTKPTTTNVPADPIPNQGPQQAFSQPSPSPFTIFPAELSSISPSSSASPVASSLPPTSAPATCAQSSCSTISSMGSQSSSLIQISALPPMPSSSATPQAFPKLKPVSLNAQFSPRTRLVLIFVCAGIGLLAGSVIAWFCFGLCMARRRRNGGAFWRKDREECKAGPEYSHNWEMVDGASLMDQEKSLSGFEGAQAHRVSRAQSNFSWDIPTRAPSVEGPQSERESFLAPPLPNPNSRFVTSRQQTRKSTRSAMRRNTTKSVYSTMTGYEAASPSPMSLLADFDEAEGDEEDEETIRGVGGHGKKEKPYENLTKGRKTIRRELLERVRQTSGSQVRRGGPLDASGNVMDSTRRRVSRGRSDSDPFFEHQEHDSRHPDTHDGAQEGDQTRWVQGSGFRIVEEELKSMWDAVGEWANTGRNHENADNANSNSESKERKSIFASWTGKDEKDDLYTPLPTRCSPSKSRGAGRSQPAKPGSRRGTVTGVSDGQQGGRSGRPERRDQEGDRPGLPRVDSSILPRSPPQIMSPPLANQLFFTPKMTQGPTTLRGATPARKGTRE